MTASANTTGSTRNATVTVSGGGLTRTIPVTQPPVILDVDTAQWSAPPEGGSQSRSVTANVSWTVSSNGAWLSISPSSGSNNGTFNMTAAANTGGARTATVTVSGGGLSRTFTVTQGPAPVLTISPTSRSHNQNAASGQTIEVTSNVTWSATSNAGWITITSGSSGSGNGSVTYSITANTSTSPRTGMITFSTTSGTTNFTVTQSPPTTLTISPTSRNHDHTAASGQTFSVSSNVNWTAESNAEWITITGGSPGSGNGTVTYSITANTSTSSRTGTITVSGGGLTPRTFTIQQAAPPPPITVTHTAPGYAAGAPVTVSVTVAGHAGASALGFVAELPAGWMYASDNTSASAKPAAGDTGLLEWLWITVPADPYTFTYTLNVPSDESGEKTVSAKALVTDAQGNTTEHAAEPNPLEIPEGCLPHSADTNQNWRIELTEVLRVIAFYNYRPAGGSRTGEYHCSPGTVDGFGPGPGSQTCTRHSADTNNNWRIELTEVLRVIAFYNYRPAGGSRTGEYNCDPGTVDGYAPGPAPVNQATNSIAQMAAVEWGEGRWLAAHASADNLGGGRLDLDLSLAYAKDASALGLRLDLPAGWTYVSDTSGAASAPVHGDDGTLEWLWINTPSAGTSFRVTLANGSGPGEPAVIEGTLLTGDAGGVLRAAHFEPLPIGAKLPLLAGALDLGEGWHYSPWFGLYADHGDWIYHAEHGWLYPSTSGGTELFFYDAGLAAWSWASEGIYPALYWFEPVNAWAFYHTGGASGDRWFYHFDLSQWRHERDL